MIDPAAHARLEHWKLSLLDLSAANRLLDMKDGKTTVPLPGADPVQTAAALADGAALAIEAGPAAGPAGTLRSPLAKPELAHRLTLIRRAARAQLADGGVHTLWLGLGILTWCDTATGGSAGDPIGELVGEPVGEPAWDTAGEPVLRSAPLALWPVELERELGGGLRLVEAAGLEPRFNQTLGEKLRREHGLALAPAGDADELDIAALLDAADAIAQTRPGWRVERAARLGIFSFGKFVMWNDLDARADELLQSPVVAHLATGAGVAFAQPSPAAEAALRGSAGPTGPTGPIEVTAAAAVPGHDRVPRPGADVVAPLDADSSQLAAVAAAGAGASFVLQGPPGTGKSQTIANLIADCMARGKTVLFVTDKRAALEVVHQRLSAIGLGEFCLELHSHKAVRAEVVAQLGRVLERAFRPVAGPTTEDVRLRELEAALDAHVAALHRAGPLGRSLHDVLGRLVELRSVARARLADPDATGLDRQTFEQRKRAVEQLSGAAIAVEPVAAHPWRASTMDRWPLDGSERAAAALDEARAAAEALRAAVSGVVGLVPGLVARTRDQLGALGALAAVAAASPRPGAELLTELRERRPARPSRQPVARDEDITEQIALIRARGTGALEAPRDPGAFLVLASRHRLLATEVNDRFTDAVAELDAHALWVQLKRWVHRLAPLRFMALRPVRAAIRAAAMPGMLETDGAMISALEAVIAERAARAALAGAAGPARRWFGELGGDPLALDLARIDAAVGWAAELRRAFDAVEVGGGDAGRAAAWRALVAQV
ncbi:MAG TPA: DUF4011 domain-containing protein, partial [Kofleriaceae bacterium]|nr:DUF4011 domain-containing protein [Kofleriaceae bacterium]